MVWTLCSGCWGRFCVLAVKMGRLAFKQVEGAQDHDSQSIRTVQDTGPVFSIYLYSFQLPLYQNQLYPCTKMSDLRKLLFSLALFGEFNNASSTTLNVTAINARNGKSHFECWALSSPFISSSQSGIVGTQTTYLGDVANVTYNTIPPGYESAVHTCPSNQ